MTRTLLLASLLFVAGPADASSREEKRPAAEEGKTHGAIQGSWRVLGPASAANVALMLEFAFQEAEPTSKAMAAVFLTPEEQDQVKVARRKAAADPTGPEVVEMRATLAALDASRIEITATELTAVSPDGETRLSYAVVTAEGLTLTVRTTAPAGSVSDLVFTLPAPGLLLMGPAGAEPLVLRRR